MYKEGKYVDYETEEDTSGVQMSISSEIDEKEQTPNLEDEFNNAKQ